MAPSVDLFVIKALNEFSLVFLELHSRKEMKEYASGLLGKVQLQTKTLNDLLALEVPDGEGNNGKEKEMEREHLSAEKDAAQVKNSDQIKSKRRRECPRTPARGGDGDGSVNHHGLMKTFTSTGKKVWKCYCDLEFNSYYKLKTHFVVKTQPKRLSCPSCPKRFYLCPQLKSHCKRVHKLAVNACSMCYMQFKTEKEYQEHLFTSLFET